MASDLNSPVRLINFELREWLTPLMHNKKRRVGHAVGWMDSCTCNVMHNLTVIMHSWIRN